MGKELDERDAYPQLARKKHQVDLDGAEQDKGGDVRGA
jgi:hypothetical protein